MNDRASSMSNWTAEAKDAIEMCEKWAAKVVIEIPCRLFLFGSAIYSNGEQFNSEQSDLDIVCLLPEPNTAIHRWGTLKSLSEHKSQLELEMIRHLKRTSCTEPGVSIVTVTELEVHANLHKSGASNFFSKNFFYDLNQKTVTRGLVPLVGSRALKYEQRQALEYVQKIRNDYLSTSANGTGGISDFAGGDPMPKSLLRTAAQLDVDAVEGEWYDTRLGLEAVFSALQERRGDHDAFKTLFDLVSVRRGGRGLMKPLSSNDQLLLAEILFDTVAAAGGSEEVAIWDITFKERSYPDVHKRELFAAVQRFVPDVQSNGWLDNTTLRVRSSTSGYQVIAELQGYDVLARMLKVESVRLAKVEGDPSVSKVSNEDSRVARIVAQASAWRPQGDEYEQVILDAFWGYLQSAIEADPLLSGATVSREARVRTMEGSYRPDFTLAWNDGRYEQVIYIEFSRLRFRTRFFLALGPLLALEWPVVFVAIGAAKVLESLKPDIAQLALSNANLRVVPIPLPPPRQSEP